MNRQPVWAREPRQARSQRTLDAILDATEILLEARPFHDIAITEIIAAADSSAGSFYARFADKQALLHALHERVAARAMATADWLRTLHAAEPASPADARRTARRVIDALVRGHRRNRGVLRAVAIAAFRDLRFTERALRVIGEMTTAGVLAMQPFHGQRAPDDWNRDVAFALRMVVATLDQLLFIPPTAGAALAHDEAQLGARLADAFNRQLQLDALPGALP